MIPLKTLLLTAVRKYRAHHGCLSIALPRLHCPNAAILLTNSALEMQRLIFQATGAKTTNMAPSQPPVPAPGSQCRGLSDDTELTSTVCRAWRRREEIYALEVPPPFSAEV